MCIPTVDNPELYEHYCYGVGEHRILVTITFLSLECG